MKIAQRIHAHTSGRQLKITFLVVLDYSDTNISTFFSRKHSFLSEEAKYFEYFELIFLELSYIFENTVSAMIRNHITMKLLVQLLKKSFECSMECCYESISEIRKVPFISKILKNTFNVKILLINLYGFLKISEFT